MSEIMGFLHSVLGRTLADSCEHCVLCNITSGNLNSCAAILLLERGKIISCVLCTFTWLFRCVRMVGRIMHARPGDTVHMCTERR